MRVDRSMRRRIFLLLKSVHPASEAICLHRLYDAVNAGFEVENRRLIVNDFCDELAICFLRK